MPKIKKKVVIMVKIIYNKYDKFRRRKLLRIQGYDYSKEGIYFITICTEKRKEILSRIDTNNNIVDNKSIEKDVGAEPCVRPQLSKIGKALEEKINNITIINNNIKIHKYVIMPNHVHMIIEISSGGQRRPPLQKIMQSLKSTTTREYWKYEKQNKLWQRTYYEHIIRNEKEYLEIYEYIEENPIKWKYDKYNNRKG